MNQVGYTFAPRPPLDVCLVGSTHGWDDSYSFRFFLSDIRATGFSKRGPRLPPCSPMCAFLRDRVASVPLRHLTSTVSRLCTGTGGNGTDSQPTPKRYQPLCENRAGERRVVVRDLPPATSPSSAGRFRAFGLGGRIGALARSRWSESHKPPVNKGF